MMSRNFTTGKKNQLRRNISWQSKKLTPKLRPDSKVEIDYMTPSESLSDQAKFDLIEQKGLFNFKDHNRLLSPNESKSMLKVQNQDL